jgi:hypothetical protein
MTSAPFRTFPHQIRTRSALAKTAPFRTAAPLPYGVRGCGAEGGHRGGNSETIRTAPHLMEEDKMKEWTGRGYLEITEAHDGYDLTDWSEHYDSGGYMGEFPTLSMAIAEARKAQVTTPHRRIVVLGETFAEDRPAP